MTEPVEVDLRRPIRTIEGLQGRRRIKILARLHGRMVATVTVPVVDGRCPAEKITDALLNSHTWSILRGYLENGLGHPSEDGYTLARLLTLAPSMSPPRYPLVTVAMPVVGDDMLRLKECLAAVERQRYPRLEVLLVGGSTSPSLTDVIGADASERTRWIRAEEPGLSHARNLAVREARGDIIAFTDCETVVNESWLERLVHTLLLSPEAPVVLGMTLCQSDDLEGVADRALMSGIGDGRRWLQMTSSGAVHGGMPDYRLLGCGRNLACWRNLFDEIGPFDPELDVDRDHSASDLDFVWRTLWSGRTVAYEPAALAHCALPVNPRSLQQELEQRTRCFGRLVARGRRRYPSLGRQLLRSGTGLMRHTTRSVLTGKGPTGSRRGELGRLRALIAGLATGRSVARAETASRPVAAGIAQDGPKDCIAVRQLELSAPLTPLTDIDDYDRVSVVVTWKTCPIASMTIANHRQPLGVIRLRQVIVNRLRLRLLWLGEDRPRRPWWQARELLRQHLCPPPLEVEPRRSEPAPQLPIDTTVSLIIATRDRPDDLRLCLRHLSALESERQIEILVVDNNPSSKLTPPVVSDFPAVRLLSEQRQGSAYARNLGIKSCRSQIIVTVDDDVIVPPDWLEKLLAPMARDDVDMVTGNLLPFELETRAQQLFEEHIGLGGGFSPYEIDRLKLDQFRGLVKAWDWGTTANAAFRSRIFSNPSVGLMEETLGPGSPAGAGEDPYLFYRAVLAGHRLAYEPSAFVWHRHRREMAALLRQAHAYTKSCVCYCLTTYFRDGDRRSLKALLVGLNLYHARRVAGRLRGTLKIPYRLLWAQISGHLAGPFAYVASQLRVRRLGRSDGEQPLEEHAASAMRHRLGLYYAELGIENLESENPRAAELALRTAIRLDPTADSAHYHLAEALATQGQLEEAEASYRSAIQSQPDEPAPHHGLGKVLAVQNRCQAAADAYETALRLQPDDPWLHFGFAELLARWGRHKDALASFQRAVELRTDEWWWHWRLEQSAIAIGDLEAAENAYRQAIAALPEESWCCTGLANVLSRANRDDEEAHTWYREALHREIRRRKPELVNAPWGTDGARGPDFLITGFARCGTTSLYQYLLSHPLVLPAAEKEPMFFNQRFELGLDWYRAHFAAVSSDLPTLTGEASSRYVDHASACRRIAESFPDVKIIVLLRDPVKRTYSDYLTSVSMGLERRPFDAVIEQGIAHLEPLSPSAFATEVRQLSPRPLLSSLYAYHLEEWFERFPHPHILLLESEQFFSDPVTSWRQVLTFLGLPELPLEDRRPYNKRAYAAMSETLSERLREFFAPHNDRLQSLLGQGFSWS